MGKESVVDYLDLIARAAEEDLAQRNVDFVLPGPAGEQIVDYLAVSKAWQEDRGWMDNDGKETGN